MSYTVSDAYSDITSALDLETPEEWDEDGLDHVSEETDLALAKIEALRACAAAVAPLSKQEREYVGRLRQRAEILHERLASTQLRDPQEIVKELHALEWVLGRLEART